LLGALTLGAVVMLVATLLDRTRSPEASSGLGPMVAVLLLAAVGVLAALFSLAVRRQSTTGLVVLVLVMAWPLVLLVARPLVLAYRERSFDRELARVGDFPDPSARAMAQAIAAGDTTELRRLLDGQPPPTATDRAGNDLLAWSIVVVRDKQGDAGPVRVLLDAGADPRRSRVEGTLDVINYLIRGAPPAARDALPLLLQHGADPNAVDAETGKTPIAGLHDEPELLRVLVEHGADIDRVQPSGVTAVVEYIGSRQWESALYLIERGARLDVRNADGLSVDYYLDSWKDSVYGEQHAGWDRVREAIARR
jgi:hypothetical protein